MSGFVTDTPHNDNSTNATNSSTNNVMRKPVSNDHIETSQPEVSNCEEQLENRQVYLRNVNANNTRNTIFPCVTNGYDADDLAIRRKQETLLHNTGHIKLTNKEYYAKLATSNALSRKACITDTPAITSTIPLYDYKRNTFASNSQTYNNLKNNAFTIDSISNVSSNTNNAFLHVVNTNPISNSKTFSLTVPIKAVVSGNLTDANDTKYMELTVTSASLNVKDLQTGNNVLSQAIDISNLSKMTMNLDQNGGFEAGLYLGNCVLNNFVLPCYKESVLAFSLQTTHTLFHAREDLLIPNNPVTTNTNIVVNVTSNAKTETNCSINEPVKSFIATNLS